MNLISAGIFAATAAIGAFVATPASAASTQWFATEGGRLRVVTGTPRADGTVPGMIDIELEPGWKTYWRDPGESGIPPSLTPIDGSDIGEAEVLFPAPVRVDDGYSVWAGYTRSVRLPVLLNSTETIDAAPEHLRATLFLGVCEKICVPVQAEIDLVVSEEASRIEDALIGQAFADLPDAPHEAFEITGIEHARHDGAPAYAITATVPDSTGDDVALFAAAPDGWRFATPVALGRDGATARFMLPVRARPDAATDGDEAIFVLTTPAHSITQKASLP